MSSPTRTAARAIAAAAMAVALFAGPLGTPQANAAPKPALTLVGSGTWQIREWIDDAVVNGTGEVEGKGLKTTDVLVAAVVQTDDRTLPAPGECEYAYATMSAYGTRGIDLTLVGDGEVCGQWTQPGTSIVTHVFTGRYEVYGDHVKPKRLVGTDGWFSVRLAEDGTAGIEAYDT